MDEPPAFFNNPRARAVDRLLRIADAPAPVANVPANDPDRFVRRPRPPAVKDSIEFPQWKKNFETLANDGPGFVILLDKLENWLTTVQSRASPSSRKKRAAMDYKWEMCVYTIEPTIDAECIWDSDVILKHADKFLYILTHISHGTKGRKTIKASTLQEYMMLFCWSIARNARDPDTGQSVGTHLLSKRGILNMLNDQVYKLINTFHLDRYQDVKLYFGRYEIKLMIEVGLRKSATSGRIIAIQAFCILLTCYYTSVRPGSLGFSCQQYQREGKYPVLADIELYCMAKMTFKVKLTIKHMKGHNLSVDAPIREYWLSPVQNWQNVTFDVAFYFVLYLFLRGALVGINTMDDLRNYTDYAILVKEEKKSEPLFLASTPGGRVFQEPLYPMSANSVSSVCRTLSREAGMPRAALYSIRRETANRYETLIGKDHAALIMGHARAGALKYYSHNTGNLDVVAITMNSLPRGHDINALHANSLNKDSTPAIQAVLSLVNIVDEENDNDDDDDDDDDDGDDDDNPVTVNPKLTHEAKSRLHRADFELNGLIVAESEAWDAWLACYSPREDGAECGRALSSRTRYLEAEGVEPIVDKDTIDKALIDLKFAAKAAGDRRRHLNRKGQRALDTREDKRRLAVLKGTLGDLQGAATQLAKPSHFLTATPATGILESMAIAGPSTVSGPSLTSTPSVPTSASTLPPPAPSASTSDPPTTITDAFEQAGISNLDPEEHSELLQKAATLDLEDEPEDSITNSSEQEGVDDEIRDMFEGVVQLIPADDRPQETAAIVDEDEPPTSVMDVEAPAPENAEFTADQIRSSFMEVILQPVFLDRAMLAMSTDDDGKWRCPRCQKLYGHDPEAQEHDHGSRTHLERHIYTKHSDWRDLVLQMLTTGNKYKCPTDGCSFKAKTEALVRSHCLKRCEKSEMYIALEKTHQEKYSAKRAIKTHHVTSIQTLKHNKRRLGAYTQILTEIRNAFDAVEDEKQRAGLQADVDSLVNQSKNLFMPESHEPVTLQDLQKLVDDLSDISEESDVSEVSDNDY